MKLLTNFLRLSGTLLAVALLPNLAGAQCVVTATSSPLTAPCDGGMVTLNASGNGNGNANVIAHFNAGLDPTITAANGDFTNPCGPGLDGTSHIWMGTSTAAPRTVVTIPLDLTCADSICFEMKFAAQGNSAPCEGPDLSNEGIYVQYSIDNGATFNTLNYYSPNGGNDPMLTQWMRYCLALPPMAQTASTIIQFYQGGSSGTCCDHWGLDNISVTGCGGAGIGYYYDWTFASGSPDSASQQVNVTSPTTYTVLYTNGINDTCSASVFVDLEMLTPTVNITPETCLNDSDGAISVSPIDGVGPFTYTWSHDSTLTASNASGLPPGNYDVTVTDTNGCGTDVYGLFVGPGGNCCGVTVNLTVLDSLCYSACDGSFTASATGGAGGYTYSYSGPISGNGASAYNLCQGTYTLSVIDSSGCQTDTSFVIPGLTGPGIDSLVVSNANCGCDGQITCYAGAGLQYSIDGGVTYQTGNTFSNLCPGNYTLMLQDSSGCQSDTIVTVLGLGSQPTITCPADTAICNGDSVLVTATASNGAGGYTYYWNNGLGVGNNFMLSPTTTTTYSVYAVDSLGCQSDSCVFTIDVCCNLNVTLSTADLSSCVSGCDGSFSASVLGGVPPFTYNYSGPTSGNTSAANNLCAGVYSLNITDLTGCAFDTTFVIGSSSVALPLACGGDTAICVGESATLWGNATGGIAPYTYNWLGEGTGSSITVTPSTTTTYALVVSDSLGCESDTCLVTVIVNPLPPTPTITQVGFFMASSSATGNQWYMNGQPIAGETSQAIEASIDGWYCVMVTDSNGCSSKSDSVQILGISIAEYGAGEDFQLFPNPNDGEFSVSFIPTAKGKHTIEIANAIGQLVYLQDVPASNGKWTQELHLTHLEAGLYYCTIRRDGVAVAVRKLMKR